MDGGVKSDSMKQFLLSCCVFLGFLTNITHGKFVQGDLSTPEKWAFLSRFCFLSVYGKIEFEIEYPVSYAPQSILLYYDSADQWPAVYKSKKTCWQKEAVLVPANNQKIILTDSVMDRLSGCSRYNASDGTLTYRCRAGRSFRSSRQRWWYIALSNCASTKNFNLSVST